LPLSADDNLAVDAPRPSSPAGHPRQLQRGGRCGDTRAQSAAQSANRASIFPPRCRMKTATATSASLVPSSPVDRPGTSKRRSTAAPTRRPPGRTTAAAGVADRLDASAAPQRAQWPLVDTLTCTVAAAAAEVSLSALRRHALARSNTEPRTRALAVAGPTATRRGDGATAPAQRHGRSLGARTGFPPSSCERTASLRLTRGCARCRAAQGASMRVGHGWGWCQGRARRGWHSRNGDA